MRFDVKVYLVTRPFKNEQGGFEELLHRVRRALESGVVGAVQLRDKEVGEVEFRRQARALLTLCQEFGARLIINDRVAAAKAVGAHGVHLGQNDMAPREARRFLGPDAIIGLSVRTPAEARSATRAGASYLGANGVWPSSTKCDFDGPPLGLLEVAKIARATYLPLIAIGGIKVRNACAAVLSGATGVAVVSAILDAPNPAEVCRNLRIKVLAGLSLTRPRR